jgi:dTDP-4-dehydrorhamnose reductase
MKTLLIGGTGLLGQAFAAELRSRDCPARTAARSRADVLIDVADLDSLDAALTAETPELVINCAALVDVGQCEADPGLAYRVNARPTAALAQWSRRTGGRLVHISTDHYFSDGGARPHLENDPIDFVNEYTRSKFAAEAFALTAPRALVFRTSIVGIRGWARPTFAEWAINVALENQPATLFADAYTSSIDVGTFARAALDIAQGPEAGLINLAAAEVYTKAGFVQEVAAQLDRPLDHVTMGSVASLTPPRPASLGLDVSHAQALLDFRLPNMSQVVAAVLNAYR